MTGSVRVVAGSRLSLGRSLPLIIGEELGRRLDRPVHRHLVDDSGGGSGVACVGDVVVVDGWRAYCAAVRCLGSPSPSIVAVLIEDQQAHLLAARPICRVVAAGSVRWRPSSGSSVGHDIELGVPADPYPSSRRSRIGTDRRWGVIGAVTPPDGGRVRRIPTDAPYDEKLALARWTDVLIIEDDHRDNAAVAVHAVASGAVVLTGGRLDAPVIEHSPAAAVVDDWSHVSAVAAALDAEAGRRRLEHTFEQVVAGVCDQLVAAIALSKEVVS